MLRNVDDLLLPAVKASIAGLPLTDSDAGVVRLAERYAAVIDAAETVKSQEWAVRNIGPLLLDALESLGATPAARARVIKDRKPAGGQSRLAQLRTAHTA